MFSPQLSSPSSPPPLLPSSSSSPPSPPSQPPPQPPPSPSPVNVSCPACPACSSSAPPTITTITHTLFHTTTRTPLLVHPSLWSLAHLDLLRVTLVHCPPPKPAPPCVSFPASTRGINPHILSDFFLSQKYDPQGPRYLELLSVVESAIGALPGSFSIDYSSKLTLQIGALPPTTLSPFATVSRSILPFAALTSPATRSRERRRHRHRHRCSLVYGPVQPSDIALLLALAQRQQSRLPCRESYTVCVLASDESGMKVKGLQAEVQTEYLDALREPWRVLPALEIRVWELDVENGEEVLDVVRAVGEVAVWMRGGKVAKMVLKKKDLEIQEVI